MAVLSGTGWLLFWGGVAVLSGVGSSVLSGTVSAVLSSAGSAVLSDSACFHHPFLLLFYFIIFFSNPFLLFLGCLRFRRFASSDPDKLSLLRIHCSRLGFFADSLGGLVLRHHEL